MRNKRNNDVINLRCYYLKLFKKLPILLLITAAGAVTGLVVYFLATVVFGPGTSYETSSILYIDFSYDPERGTLVDYYNAYTWNTLMGTDEISDRIMEYLSADDYAASVIREKGLSKTDILSTINAAIPSDVRVMVLTVTDPDRDLAIAITGAARSALEDYGRSNPAFDSIKLLTEKTEATPQVFTDRSLAAAILGAVIFFLAAVLIMMLIEAMNDTVYVPEDAEKLFGRPVLGVLEKEGPAARPAGSSVARLSDMLRGELISAIDGLSARKHVAVVSVTDYTPAGHTPATPVNTAAGPERRYTDATVVTGQLAALLGGTPAEGSRMISATLPSGMITLEASCVEDLLPNAPVPAGTRDVILAVRFGKHNRAMTERLISLLGKHGNTILGLLITDADPVFLKLYYAGRS